MSKNSQSTNCRNLVVVLGDQLNADSSAFDGFDSSRDTVWMAEVAEESTHVWTHKARIVMFLSSMRHFRDELILRGLNVHYRQLDDQNNKHSLVAELRSAICRYAPEKIIITEPGEWRVLEKLKNLAAEMNVEIEIRVDRHFFCSQKEFADYARGRKQLRLEYFYRKMRRKHGVLMKGDQPEGGKWNYDNLNRGTFGRQGPKQVPSTKCFKIDETTREVIELVQQRFADHPGQVAAFDWPVTRNQALQSLSDFIEFRLAKFGLYQDAMWSDMPYLYHSRLSAALNLKLISPREVIEEAINAYKSELAPLSSVEGFVRQILGWREFVRGIYWYLMPDYLQKNTLQATHALPSFYWNGKTEMSCLQQTIKQTLQYGYAHHIQRLMVTGLFALLLGVDPQAVHQWYLAVYVDAVEWVELPNSLGMSQYADGGIMASKPYIASGKYIQRMSNYCSSCCYDPAKSVGDDACPFTILYWDFLERHNEILRTNPRMSFQLKNLSRKEASEMEALRKQAAKIRKSYESDSA